MTVLEEDFENILRSVSLTRLAGSNVFITGAAGFIGSYLMDLFSFYNRNYSPPVTVLGCDTMVAASREVESEFVRLVRGDTIIPHCDFYLHTASIASALLFMAKPLATIHANVQMTDKVLELAYMAKSILHFSSVEVYGEPEVVPTPESYLGRVDFTNPRTGPYAESKRLSETLCQVYWLNRNRPVKIVRPFNIYGPGEKLQDGRLVPQAISAIMGRHALTVHGEGKATRSLLYISDAVIQFLFVLLDGENGQAYNVGDQDSEISITGFAMLMRDNFGMRLTHIANERIDAPSRRRPDCTKILSIAPPPKVNLVDGLKRTLRYYVEEQGQDRQ